MRKIKMNREALCSFEACLGYVFRNRSLLEEALTHSSFAHEQGLSFSNERLEFLGDAVLQLCVSDSLFDSFPDRDEGALSQIRSSLVCEKSLVQWALSWDLPSLLRLGKGLEKEGGRQNPSILADAVEALLGAVFVDGGYEAARRVVRRFLWERRIPVEIPKVKDPKSSLQERLQAQGLPPPEYLLKDTFNPLRNEAFFKVEVRSAMGILGTGCGTSKKEAEFEAARKAIDYLQSVALFPQEC